MGKRTDRRRKQKKFGVEFLGGKCESCGYAKCIQALTFHHKNPKEKSVNFSSDDPNWEEFKAEIKKCQLLCANCHIELHNGVEMRDNITSKGLSLAYPIAIVSLILLTVVIIVVKTLGV
jgi:hypothetical protein